MAIQEYMALVTSRLPGTASLSNFKAEESWRYHHHHQTLTIRILRREKSFETSEFQRRSNGSLVLTSVYIQRVAYNLSRYSANYAVLFCMLCIYSLLTNWLLLFVILFIGVGMFVINRLNGENLQLGPISITSSQLYTGLICVSVPLGFLASPISTVLWLIGASGVVILGHASLLEPPVESAFEGEQSV
ncbi:Prenylated Rab acceptor 1 [Neolecta irregularis DAH-3]|uniref:PRA1 family protein n=1 Tax=Neolecta irregularis (strain DAH-3) TaxID=1198029 RepID=A0A1U7LIQ1_NEOID|nr:Prenylated Rab acceptor 1 [Neolecta irregularis DAH-3]|eukprot:OLL22524.1 Prenylated Rab acceptor 1 [Neolecta irregularis DAH-3]